MRQLRSIYSCSVLTVSNKCWITREVAPSQLRRKYQRSSIFAVHKRSRLDYSSSGENRRTTGSPPSADAQEAVYLGIMCSTYKAWPVGGGTRESPPDIFVADNARSNLRWISKSGGWNASPGYAKRSSDLRKCPRLRPMFNQSKIR